MSKSKNNKNRTILTVIIAALALTVVTTAYLNKDSVAERKSLNKDAVFIIMENGEEIDKFDMERIRSLGETKFKANLKKSGKDPVEYEYTGVLLKDVFKEAGVTLDDKEAIIVTAADGYAVSTDIKKVLEDDNVYLAYMVEGEPIGTKEEGGKGPYQMVVSKDQFSQYWCKFALSAEAK